jgi:hypothetical protein
VVSEAANGMQSTFAKESIKSGIIQYQSLSHSQYPVADVAGRLYLVFIKLPRPPMNRYFGRVLLSPDKIG